MKAKTSSTKSKDVKIVILQRGWVFIGYYHPGAAECRLENAQCIRFWGTTKGLGELRTGPTEKTKLDPAGTVRFHPLTVIATVDCEAAKWASSLV